MRTSFRLVSSRASLFLARPGAGGCRPALIQPQLDHFSDYHRQIRSQGGPIFLRLLLLLQPLMPQLPGWLEAARKKISKNSKTFDTRSKITRRKFKNSKLPNSNLLSSKVPKLQSCQTLKWPKSKAAKLLSCQAPELPSS